MTFVLSNNYSKVLSNGTSILFCLFLKSKCFKSLDLPFGTPRNHDHSPIPHSSLLYTNGFALEEPPTCAGTQRKDMGCYKNGFLLMFLKLDPAILSFGIYLLCARLDGLRSCPWGLPSKARVWKLQPKDCLRRSCCPDPVVQPSLLPLQPPLQVVLGMQGRREGAMPSEELVAGRSPCPQLRSLGLPVDVQPAPCLSPNPWEDTDNCWRGFHCHS